MERGHLFAKVGSKFYINLIPCSDHFCYLATGHEIAFPFAVCKEDSLLTEWGTSRFSTCLTMYYSQVNYSFYSNMFYVLFSIYYNLHI